MGGREDEVCVEDGSAANGFIVERNQNLPRMRVDGAFDRSSHNSVRFWKVSFVLIRDRPKLKFKPKPKCRNFCLV